jgi:NAD(P)-dependent dehydrogenase (short-subunit alcohol dehydrogenase family)
MGKGIGLETALALVRASYKVIAIAHNPEKSSTFK